MHERALRRGPRGLYRWRVTWGRWLALFALVFAVPASEHLVRELAAVVCDAAGDDCGDGCDESAGLCLDGCGHCACCHPPMAPSVATVALAIALSEGERTPLARAAAPPVGVRTSLFRPPTA
jgi:hypothetical protein